LIGRRLCRRVGRHDLGADPMRLSLLVRCFAVFDGALRLLIDLVPTSGSCSYRAAALLGVRLFPSHCVGLASCRSQWIMPQSRVSRVEPHGVGTVQCLALCGCIRDPAGSSAPFFNGRPIVVGTGGACISCDRGCFLIQNIRSSSRNQISGEDRFGRDRVFRAMCCTLRHRSVEAQFRLVGRGVAAGFLICTELPFSCVAKLVGSTTADMQACRLLPGRLGVAQEWAGSLRSPLFLTPLPSQ